MTLPTSHLPFCKQGGESTSCKNHEDTNDYKCGFGLAEGFGYPSLSAVGGGRLVARLASDVAVTLGQLAVCTFHSVTHFVEKAVRATPRSKSEADDGIRGALIFQNYHKTIYVADALRNNPDAEIIDLKQTPNRIQELVFAGKIKMTDSDWKHANGGGWNKNKKWIPRPVDQRYVDASKLPINMSDAAFKVWYAAQTSSLTCTAVQEGCNLNLDLSTEESEAEASNAEQPERITPKGKPATGQDAAQTMKPSPQKRQKVESHANATVKQPALNLILGKHVKVTINNRSMKGTFKATVVETRAGGLDEEAEARLEFDKACLSLPKWHSLSSLQII